jgi:hypothetical protein
MSAKPPYVSELEPRQHTWKHIVTIPDAEAAIDKGSIVCLGTSRIHKANLTTAAGCSHLGSLDAASKGDGTLTQSTKLKFPMTKP